MKATFDPSSSSNSSRLGVGGGWWWDSYVLISLEFLLVPPEDES